MNLAVFLAIGESIEDFKNKGQDSLIINNNYEEYSKNFKFVYVFSYKNEHSTYFNNVIIIPNKYKLHRYLYAFLLPFLNAKILARCSIIRCYQLTGGIPGVISKLFFGKKFIINYGYDYSLYAKLDGKRILSIFLKLIEIPILVLADFVITTTKKLQRRVKKYNNNTLVIPNGINTSIFKNNHQKKTIDILYVGRLESQKNLDLIIKAVESVSVKKLKVMMIGTGSLEKYLSLQASVRNVNLNIQKPVSNINLPKFYNRARIFILPSRIEGNPKSLLEAMSCGMTVIGNNTEGISSIINNQNGLLFNKSLESLVKSLERIINNKQAQIKKGQLARETILREYDFNNLFKKEIFLLKKTA